MSSSRRRRAATCRSGMPDFCRCSRASSRRAGSTPATRAKLEPIVEAAPGGRQASTPRSRARRARASELDQRAAETRQNLEAIKKDPAAGALRKKLVGPSRSVLEGRRQARPRARRAADQAHRAEGRARGRDAVARSERRPGSARAEAVATRQASVRIVAQIPPPDFGTSITAQNAPTLRRLDADAPSHVHASPVLSRCTRP